jgi:acetolactate synthase-1/2/3 large subunit
MNGGEWIAEVLAAHGVRFLFTLCGGHISPILVGCKRKGIRVVDVRDEKNAVFAADAVSRLTGVPGVAAVTAGPGVTNTITAIKNAQLAQSPLILLGGATAGVLKGRGALQDIDQLAAVRPHVKAALSVKRVRDLPDAVNEAFVTAQEGVPGPVFVECPIDLLYDESLVREWFAKSGSPGSGKRSAADRLLTWYLNFHVNRLFAGSESLRVPVVRTPDAPVAGQATIRSIAARLRSAKRPLLVIGSQALADARSAGDLATAIERIGAPVYLSGMARGLLGASSGVQMRHGRKNALKQADFVVLAGVPADFRLNYGRDIGRGVFLVSINRSEVDVRKNRRPDVAVVADASNALQRIAEFIAPDAGQTLLSAPPAEERWNEWRRKLRDGDRARDEEIAAQSALSTEFINPLDLCRRIDAALADDSMLVADGGDFVGTASYIVRPRSPLSWLDPGAYGTLGVGAGFALAAKLCRPAAEVWLLYGDGSVGFTLSEFDTFTRHGIPVIAVVGNDGCWSQIAREQVEILHDDVGCTLGRAAYERAAEGFGARGLLLRDPADIDRVLADAKQLAAAGHPVLINAWIGRTEFRKGSISM